jgi:hypothetical protein
MKVMAVLRQVFGDISAASAYRSLSSELASPLRSVDQLMPPPLQLQHAAPEAGRQAHAEAFKGQTAEGTTGHCSPLHAPVLRHDSMKH